MNKKICIVITSLANGGTERFGATLSLMLTELGYHVYILITKDMVEYNYSGELYNLEKEAGSNQSIYNRLRLLNTFFKAHKFDVIIDNRARRIFLKELIIYKVFYRSSRVISMVHNHNISNYFPANRMASKRLYSSNSMFVSVSKKIKESITNTYGFKNVKAIYNPINLNEINLKASMDFEPLGYNYILYFGRLEEHSKNFTLLINSYAKSTLKNEGIKLVIMGKGEDYNYVKDLINSHNLNNHVILKDYLPQPFPYVKVALFTVLSSRYEGFPMSIIESLAVGTPVVSVDCESGPNEIISNLRNGMLVKNNDVEALSKAFDTMVLNKELYSVCKSNAKASVSHLDVNKIVKQWYKLIENE